MRGAWIEIAGRRPLLDLKPSLPVRGAWIEIMSQPRVIATSGGRSPCGERGLKVLQGEQHPQHNPSLPVRGAWIEIEARIQCRHAAESLPVRGAWIEMTADAHGTPITLVAPRAGSVD